MRRLRITLVLKTNEGGRWIVPHVEEMLKRGHEVTLILPPGNGRLVTMLRELNVTIVDSAFDFAFSPKLSTIQGLLKLRHQILKTRPDVVHYHLYASALAARISTFRLDIPKVHMVAGPLYLESAKIRFVERILMRLDDVVIAGSENTAHRYSVLGLEGYRLRTLPYGVNIVDFRPPSAEEAARAREELGLSKDTFVAVMVAYVYGPKKLVHAKSGIKGHEILLAAWRQFAAQKRDVKLILVGNGFDDQGELHRSNLMKEYDEVDGIRFVNNVRDVRPYYWGSDVSVSPSLSENHGAALEAGACGVARIVSDAGGLPETTNENSGWVVPRGDISALRDALQEAYEEFHTGALKSKALASRDEVLARFDARRSACKIVDILEEAVSARANYKAATQATLISEARLGTSPHGVVAAIDASSATGAWRRYAARIPSFRLAARTTGVLGTGHVPIEGVTVEPLHYYTGLSQLMVRIPRVLVQLWRVVRTSKVIIVRLPGPLGLLAFPIAEFLSKPIFVEVVGDPETVLREHKSAVVRFCALPAKRAMQYCVLRATASRFVTANVLQSIYPPQPGAPTFVMSNVQLRDEDFRSGFEAPSGTGWNLTAIGSQETDYKGHDVGLRALQLLHDRGYECSLLLVGRGALHEELRKLADDLGVAHSVTFRESFEEKHELWEILDKTDIVIHPSRSEGLPRVVIEAMARSRPVVATAVGGLSELLPQDELIRPGDAQALADRVAHLIDHPLEAGRASALNYGIAGNYHYDRLEKVFGEWCKLISTHLHT